MIDPKSVCYDGVEDLQILFTSENGSYSIARLKYFGKEKIAFRWNGNERTEDIGTPTSHGNPTWMFLPDGFIQSLHSALDRVKKG